MASKSANFPSSSPRWREAWQKLDVGDYGAVGRGHHSPAAVKGDGQAIHVVSVFQSLLIGSLPELHYKRFEADAWHPSAYDWYEAGLPPGRDSASSHISIDSNGPPSAAMVGTKLAVFVTTLSKDIWRWTSDQSMQSWEPIGAPGAGCNVPPTAVNVLASNVPDLVLLARDTDGSLFVREPGSAQWTPFGDFSGTVTIAESPTGVSPDGSRVDAFARKPDLSLHHRWKEGNGPWQPSAGWEPFGPDGATFLDAPQAVSWGPGRIDVFASTKYQSKFGTIHRAWKDGAWSDWDWVANAAVNQVRPVTWGPGRLDLFGCSVSGPAVHKWWQQGLGWHPADASDDWPVLHGLQFYSTRIPAVTAWPNRLDVFMMRRGVIRHKWWDGASWRPLVPDFPQSPYSVDPADVAEDIT